MNTCRGEASKGYIPKQDITMKMLQCKSVDRIFTLGSKMFLYIGITATRSTSLYLYSLSMTQGQEFFFTLI